MDGLFYFAPKETTTTKIRANETGRNTKRNKIETFVCQKHRRYFTASSDNFYMLSRTFLIDLIPYFHLHSQIALFHITATNGGALRTVAYATTTMAAAAALFVIPSAKISQLQKYFCTSNTYLSQSAALVEPVETLKFKKPCFRHSNSQRTTTSAASTDSVRHSIAKTRLDSIDCRQSVNAFDTVYS